MNNIKSLREKSGKIQQDVADEAGITRVYLSALENGKKRPSIQTAESLANVYGVSTAEVLGYLPPDDNGHELQDIRSHFEEQIRELKERHSREILEKQTIIDSLSVRLEETQHSLSFARSMCDMLTRELEHLRKEV